MNQIEEIKNRIDVVELISGYVQLTPGGANFKGRCPFHAEKTPSFMVSRDKGIWHCFGCGKGGDIFVFVQEIENMDFKEALTFLAQRAGVELTRQDPKERTERQRFLEINQLAADVYHKLLLEHEKAEPARQYLQKRGLSKDVCKQFQIGYAPDAWEGVTTFLKQRGYSDAELITVGLAVKREQGGGTYDRFRNRIMFPVSDQLGRVVGFGGRALAPDQVPKYVNTPQTPLYNKSAVLYGMDKAKQAIKEQGYAVVVEGYMDVIASHRAGIIHAVASSGTALTRDQLRLLKRYTETIALSFDADSAGSMANLRGIDLAWDEGLNVKVVVLPFGKDPDEVVSKNPEAWRGAVNDAQPIMEYVFALVQKSVSLFSAEGKKEAAKKLLPFIAHLTDTIEQTHYLQKLARLINVNEDLLRSRITKKPVAKTVPATKLPADDKPKTRAQRIAEQLLAIASNDVVHLQYLIDHLEPEYLSQTNLLGLYKSLITYYTKNHEFDQNAFLQALGREDPKLAHDAEILFLFGTSDLLPQDEAQRRADVLDGVAVLKRLHLQMTLEGLQRDLQTAEADQDHARVQALAEQVRDVTAQLSSLQ